MHRCDAQGRNVRPMSSNNEQENTPWPMPDGRILYTRWEYVDRSQVTTTTSGPPIPTAPAR